MTSYLQDHGLAIKTIEEQIAALDSEKVLRRALMAEIKRLRTAHEKILRLPYKPFPDPVAHSWHAYALAVFRAYQDMRQIARDALNPSGTVTESGAVPTKALS